MEYSEAQDYRYFITHWKHQYMKRNVDFVSDLFKVKKGEISAEHFCDKYNTIIMSDDYYDSLCSSTEILCCLMSDTFDYGSLIIEKRANVQLMNIVADSQTQDYVKKLYDAEIIIDSGGKPRIMSIDFSAPLASILSEVKMYYGMVNEVDEIYKEGWDEACYKEIQRTGALRRRPREEKNLTRAVGLWLWDYRVINQIPWKHRAKTYSAFRKDFQNPNKPELFIDKYKSDNQLAELLDATNNCIERMEVLPMG
ncbi:MAG: hypothetical protein HY795_15670 [Desulfovibrio sp.]|nr:hypothetical protein [Desulfovibrio sp.]MBI4958740.1 hypothetical protein [Desulfovibrio sp.]